MLFCSLLSLITALPTAQPVDH